MTLPAGTLLDRAGQDLPLAELAGLWPLGGWTSVSLVPGGKNEHLRVAAADGIHYLRRSYRAKPMDELVRQLGLMRLLRDRGFPAPEVVPSSAGPIMQGSPAGGGSPPAASRETRSTAARRPMCGRWAGCSPDTTGPSPTCLRWWRSRPCSRSCAAGPRSRVWIRPCVTRTERVVEELSGLLPELPRVVVHGGARRGSLVFDGDQVAGVLDFDSAHPDVRVLDLAVAVHDVGKVYTRDGDDGNKVALDLGRVTELLAAYSRDVRPTAAELEALPLLLEAKRLKRGLGRRGRVRDGEALSGNDYEKIRLEDQRLAWLDGHREALAAVCRGVLR